MLWLITWVNELICSVSNDVIVIMVSFPSMFAANQFSRWERELNYITQICRVQITRCKSDSAGDLRGISSRMANTVLVLFNTCFTYSSEAAKTCQPALIQTRLILSSQWSQITNIEPSWHAHRPVKTNCL